MPAPNTIQSFVDLGLKSGLLEREVLQDCQRCWKDSGNMPSTPLQLADALIERGALTRFQAEKLMSGRWRGFIIAGKYRLLERLGAGGMGAVYLAEHIHMGRKVAIKVLPLAQAGDEASLKRFYREARAVARLDHPNIVRAHDIDHEDKLHFLVLEFVDGCNLHDFIRKNGPLSPARAAHFIRQAALGLQQAHEAGLVHRDMKPGNLLLDRAGCVKLLDMGLARFFHEDTAAFIKQFEVGYIIGTADYVAPEQINDSRVDIRADIYSLGGTFYYLLTGKSPFQDGTNAQKMIWHQVRQPKSLRILRPDVPEALVQVFEKMVAKEPDRRHQTPKEVAEALEPFTREWIAPPTAAEMPPSILNACSIPLSQTMHATPTTSGTDRDLAVEQPLS
jgi:serine/threonine protein kinase